MVKYIKDICEQSKETAFSDEKLLEWAQSYLNLHKEVIKDYTGKYEQYKIDTQKVEKSQEIITKLKVEEIPVVGSTESLEETEIFKEFKAYKY